MNVFYLGRHFSAQIWPLLYEFLIYGQFRKYWIFRAAIQNTTTIMSPHHICPLLPQINICKIIYQLFYVSNLSKVGVTAWFPWYILIKYIVFIFLLFLSSHIRGNFLSKLISKSNKFFKTVYYVLHFSSIYALSASWEVKNFLKFSHFLCWFRDSAYGGLVGTPEWSSWVVSCKNM
jgi:hypothetical protein